MAELKFGISDVVAGALEQIRNDGYTVQRWIPCSERMPDDKQDVLYVWRSQNGTISVLYGWHFNLRGFGSAWHQAGCGMHRPDEEVTHWMPLPEPPEGGADE